MRVVYISNFKNRIAAGFIFILLLILLVVATRYATSELCNQRIYSEGCFEFKHPIQITVSRILVSNKTDIDAIETGLSFTRPVINEFSTYESINGKFSFEYPSAFMLSPKDFESNEILYHIDIQNKPADAHGLVQVWNLSKPLKTFLDESKVTSMLQYKYFDMQPLYVNNLQGYYWNYEVQGNDGINYKGMEAFLQKNNKMYRISYFVPTDKWNKTQSDIFWNMVKSFKLN